MTDRIDRMKIEVHELTEKINKLKAFISNRDMAIVRVGIKEYHLLLAQYGADRAYRDVLTTRLDKATKMQLKRRN